MQLDCYSPFCCSFIYLFIFLLLSFLCSLVLFCFLFLFFFYSPSSTFTIHHSPFTSHLPPTTSLQPPFPFSLPYSPPYIFHPSSFTSHHFTIPAISPSTFPTFHYRLCSPCLFHVIIYSLWSVEVYLYISDGSVMGGRVRVSVFSGYTRMGDYIGIMPL